MQYGLIGEYLGHSFSKIVHGYLAEYDYELCELTPEELDGFMKRREFCAINVTIPYKGAVIPYLSYIDPEAERIGAVNTIVKNKNSQVSSCDLLYIEDLDSFHQEYVTHTNQVAQTCTDRDLSDKCMVIGTSAIVDTELDGVVGMNSGIFNNPFLFWGKYRKKLFRYELPVSFQFHHTQMDGAHAGRFLANLQQEINRLA